MIKRYLIFKGIFVLSSMVLSRRPIARLIGGSEGRMENRMKNQALGELESEENNNRK